MSFNNIRAIVTDIEGTTSSIRFVHEVLFPYAAQHIAAYVTQHAAEPAVREQLDAVAALSGITNDNIPGLCQQLLNWIQQDQKITPLKALQGMIWKNGYVQGDFTGHVYADACRNLKHWHEQGMPLYVYSSGSVAAQKLIFGYSDFGDLTPYFSGYFDTNVGGKKESASYQAITQQLQLPADQILFLSDVPAELDAAAAAGMAVCQLVRDDQIEFQDRYPAVADFDAVNALLA